MQRISAELVGRLPDLRLGHDLAPISLEPGVRYRFLDGAVSALDEHLRPVQRRTLDVPPTAELLAATPDLMHVVVTDARSVVIVGPERSVPVEVTAADSATLLPDGRLLVTAPRLQRLEHQGRQYDAKAEHLVFLVDLDSGHVLDQTVLDVVDAGVFAVPHPHDGSVILDAGMGQDGSSIHLARVLDGSIDVEPVAEDVVAASFAPSGDRLLLMAHPSFDDRVSLLEWPSRRSLARLHADDLAIEDLAFDLYGCFLSDQRILVKTVEHGLMLCSGQLDPMAWITMELPSATGDVELSTTLGIAANVFAAELWDGKSSSATIWRIPPMAIDAG